MQVTPDAYRGDIARSKEAIAQLSLEAGAPAVASGRHIVRQRMLLRQLAALEEGLARAEAEWAQAQARGAGVRLIDEATPYPHAVRFNQAAMTSAQEGTMNEDYIIEPIAADEERMADGVCVNEVGEWLGEFTTNIADDGTSDDKVLPFCDEDGDYIPAPDGWRTRIVERVR